jgi:hypothetical protein
MHHSEDARPEAWSPDQKIVFIDPDDLQFTLSADPTTNRLYTVQMEDCRGEVLAQFCPRHGR